MPRNPDAALTKAALLDAGLELLLERGVDLGLRTIPVTEVAARAGRTTGSVYQIWPTQPEFHRDLALAAIRRDAKMFPPQVLIDKGAKVLKRGGTIEEYITVAADGYLPELAESPAFFLVVHFWAAALSDELLSDAIRATYAESQEEYTVAYQLLLDYFGRRAKAPHTAADIALGIRAIAEGFALRLGFDPTAMSKKLKKGQISVFASAVLGFVDQMTEPVD